MELQGLYDYATMVQLFQDGEISLLQFYYNNEGERDQYETFCNENGLQMNDESAEEYKKWKEDFIKNADC